MEQGASREPGNNCLTHAEFAALLTETLNGRALSSTERHLLGDFFNRYAPLQAAPVRQALLVAVEDKGTQLHMRFYLDVVRTVRMERKGETS